MLAGSVFINPERMGNLWLRLSASTNFGGSIMNNQNKNQKMNQNNNQNQNQNQNSNQNNNQNNSQNNR